MGELVVVQTLVELVQADQGRSPRRGICGKTASVVVCRRHQGVACLRASKLLDSRMRGFHLTVGIATMAFSDPMAFDGNFSVILTEDWR